MASQRIKPVAAAIVLNAGRVLVTRRAAGEHLAGFWEFPGGKIEANESPHECIVRELREELSVEVSAGVVIAENLHRYEGGSIRLIAVEAQILSGEICLTVHDEHAWLPPKDLLALNLAPADIPIAKELVRRIEKAQLS